MFYYENANDDNSVTQLPTKTAVYATLCGLLNVKNGDFGGEIVSRAATDLTQAFHTNNAKAIKLLVRFFAELAKANVIRPAVVLSILGQLLSSAQQQQQQQQEDPSNVSQRRSDFFIFVIFATLPYIAQQLAQSYQDELDNILNGVEAYLAKRSTAVNMAITIYETEEVCFINCVFTSYSHHHIPVGTIIPTSLHCHTTH